MTRIGTWPVGPGDTSAGSAGSAAGWEGGEGLSGYSDTNAWMRGMCPGCGLYGSPAVYCPEWPAEGNLSVNVASSERWKGGKVADWVV